jgi:hypothetical protein
MSAHTPARRVPFRERRPGAYLAIWVASAILVLVACTAHIF